jgi:hypothetical protein
VEVGEGAEMGTSAASSSSGSSGSSGPSPYISRLSRLSRRSLTGGRGSTLSSTDGMLPTALPTNEPNPKNVFSREPLEMARRCLFVTAPFPLLLLLLLLVREGTAGDGLVGSSPPAPAGLLGDHEDERRCPRDCPPDCPPD